MVSGGHWREFKEINFRMVRIQVWLLPKQPEVEFFEGWKCEFGSDGDRKLILLVPLFPLDSNTWLQNLIPYLLFRLTFFHIEDGSNLWEPVNETILPCSVGEWQGSRAVYAFPETFSPSFEPFPHRHPSSHQEQFPQKNSNPCYFFYISAQLPSSLIRALILFPVDIYLYVYNSFPFTNYYHFNLISQWMGFSVRIFYVAYNVYFF